MLHAGVPAAKGGGFSGEGFPRSVEQPSAHLQRGAKAGKSVQGMLPSGARAAALEAHLLSPFAPQRRTPRRDRGCRVHHRKGSIGELVRRQTAGRTGGRLSLSTAKSMRSRLLGSGPSRRLSGLSRVPHQAHLPQPHPPGRLRSGRKGQRGRGISVSAASAAAVGRIQGWVCPPRRPASVRARPASQQPTPSPRSSFRDTGPRRKQFRPRRGPKYGAPASSVLLYRKSPGVEEHPVDGREPWPAARIPAGHVHPWPPPAWTPL